MQRKAWIQSKQLCGSRKCTRIVPWMSGEQSTTTPWHWFKSCYQCADSKALGILYLSNRWRLVGSFRMRPLQFQRKGLLKGQSPHPVWTQQQTGKITAPVGHQTLTA